MAWPTLVAIRQAVRPLTNKEIEAAVATALGLTEAQRAHLKSHRGRGSRTMLDYRLAWSRTLLKNMGAITNPTPAHWTVTTSGKNTTEEDVRRFTQRMYQTLGERAEARRAERQNR